MWLESDSLLAHKAPEKNKTKTKTKKINSPTHHQPLPSEKKESKV